MKKYFIISFLCFNAWLSAAQQVRFTRYGIKEGLSNETVNCLYRDSRGFLWVGTDFGLNRFDGVRFEKWFHKPGDIGSLLSNKINSIAEDRQQKLWLGTDKGIAVYDTKAGSFSSYTKIEAGSKIIGDLSQVKTFCDREGDVWIGSSSGYIFLYRQSERKFYVIPVPLRPPTRLQNEFVSGFLHDSKNRIWAGSSYGVYLIDKKDLSAKAYRFPGSLKNESSVNACTRLFETSDGTILCGTWNSGFIIFNEAEKKFTAQDKAEGQFLPSPVVFDFAQQDSLIYFAGITGVFTCLQKDLHDPSFTKYKRYSSNPQDIYSLGSNENSAVLTGTAGTVWVGGAMGVSQLNTNSRYFQFYTFDKAVSLPDWAPSSIAQKNDQLYLVVEHDVLGFDLQQNEFYKLPLNIRGKKRHGLFETVDGFFLPSQTGLYIYDKNLALKKSITESLPTGAVANMLCALYDRDKNLWIGTTRYGIRKTNPLTGTASKYLHDSSKLNSLGHYINSIIETDKGTIYAGGNEFYVYNKAKNDFELPVPGVSGFPFKNVTRLKQQGKRIWVGSGDGLFLYDEELKKVTPHPLPPQVNQVISDMEIDAAGNVWMITLSGLVKYNPADKSTLLFDKQNGWPGNFSVLKKLTDGRIAVGCNGGIILFNPADVKSQVYSPVPQITALIVDERTMHHLPGSDSLYEIKYKQGIRFNYISLTYSNAEANQYEWQLQGFDNNWHPAGNQTTQAFTSLAPGSYTFLVRSSNAANVRSNGYATVKFIVLPPFYLTWWFMAAVVLMLGGLAYAFYRYRLQQGLAVEKIRTRIATDLHDDIGATLSSISFYSEAVKQKLRDDQAGTESILEKMGETSRSMVGNMSDIVWAINPVNDAAGSLFKRMYNYAADLCQLKNVQLQFDHDSSMEKKILDIESRKNIYLVFKEAVNNALKYSECSGIKISMSMQHKQFTMSVHDNGKGFDVEETRAGNGLANMKMRAAELNGKLEIVSSAAGGTHIELVCPIP